MVRGLTQGLTLAGDRMPATTETKPAEGAGGRRTFTGHFGMAVTAFCLLAALYHILHNGTILVRLDLYIGPAPHAAASLGLLTIVVLLFHTARPDKRRAKNDLPWYDIILILAAIASYGYPVFFRAQFVHESAGGYLPTPLVVLAILAIIPILEAGRRVLGTGFALLAALVIVYLFLTEYTPGLLYMHDIEISRIMWQLYASPDGLFGVSAKTASTIVIMFVFFSAFMARSEAGDFFTNLAFALFGHVRGGPAKAAVIGSSLFGTFSGSPNANVAGVGVITIPMMKRVGYTPEVAGAIEATASMGGQIMPPVMGVCAFIMADWLGIHYWSICVAALAPALLYYLALFIMVDGQAVKLGLHGLPKAELPKFWPVLRSGWYWIVPIVVILITLAVLDYEPAYCGFLATLSIFPLSFIKKEKRFTLKSTAQSLQRGMIIAGTPVVACGLAGLFVGGLVMTGIGLKLSSLLIQLAGNNLFILLVITAIASLLLGTGLPTIPSYIMVAVLIAPALVKMGVPLLAAHLFVFFYAVLGFVTPPTASAAYTAAAIAESEPIRTSIWATRLAVVEFLVPFAIVYNPGIMLSGPPSDIVRAVVMSLLGTVAIAFASGGHAFTSLNWLQRIILIVGGFMMYLPDWRLFVPGLLLSALTMLWQLQEWQRVRVARKQAVISPEIATDTKG